jgi:hypothetical protein
MNERTVADELRSIAEAIERNGWHPETRSLIHMLSVDGWDAMVTHFGEELVVPWERAPGRTQAEVVTALRRRADEIGGDAR